MRFAEKLTITVDEGMKNDKAERSVEIDNIMLLDTFALQNYISTFTGDLRCAPLFQHTACHLFRYRWHCRCKNGMCMIVIP